jgi:hypothetical protein
MAGLGQAGAPGLPWCNPVTKSEAAQRVEWLGLLGHPERQGLRLDLAVLIFARRGYLESTFTSLDLKS